jgi:hypothetical protein
MAPAFTADLTSNDADLMKACRTSVAVSAARTDAERQRNIAPFRTPYATDEGNFSSLHAKSLKVSRAMTAAKQS